MAGCVSKESGSGLRMISSVWLLMLLVVEATVLPQFAYLERLPGGIRQKPLVKLVNPQEGRNLTGKFLHITGKSTFFYRDGKC
jgi:hypothetical protein